MWDHPKTADRLSLLADQLRSAQAVTPDLVSHVIDELRALGCACAVPRKRPG